MAGRKLMVQPAGKAITDPNLALSFSFADYFMQLSLPRHAPHFGTNGLFGHLNPPNMSYACYEPYACRISFAGIWRIALQLPMPCMQSQKENNRTHKIEGAGEECKKTLLSGSLCAALHGCRLVESLPADAVCVFLIPAECRRVRALRA